MLGTLFDGVGFVVLTHGTSGEHAPLLESLLADHVPAASILVVHNPTSDGDPPPRLPSPEISVLRPDSNVGYAAGMNLGIRRQRECGADPIVIFTHDVRLGAGALERLLEASRRTPAYAVVGPVLMWPGGAEPFSFGGRTRPNGTVGHIKDPAPPGPDGLLDCDWVDGSAMVLRGEALDQLGGFDERFFGYCEESDLCLRATRAGWRVGVVADALAEQDPGGKKRPGAWTYLTTRNGMEYARRAAGARGVAATLRRSLGRAIFLAVRVLARGSQLRPGPAREPWVELVALLRGTADFLRSRWGPPPPNLPGLGDMTVSERPVRTPMSSASTPVVRVLHLGPDHRMGGGMPAVVRSLLASPLGERYRLEVVATYKHRDPVRRLAWFLAALVRLAIWSVTDRGRLVHVHTTVRGSMYRKSVYVLLAKALGRRVVVHIHAGVGDFEDFDGRIRWPSRLLFRHAFARADAVLSVSGASARALSRAFGRHDVLVVPNAAPRVNPSPRADAPAGTEPLLLYLGGFANPAKGGDLLLEALPLIAAGCPELRVALAGPGDLPPAGRALVQSSPQISWCSWLDEPRKAAAFHEADLVIVPSRSEGLPVSLLEAMAYGLAIVATAVGGIPEILTDGVDAILVKPGQPVALAGAVCALARDPDRRLRLGAMARSRAQRLNDHDVSDRLDALYRELLAS